MSLLTFKNSIGFHIIVDPSPEMCYEKTFLYLSSKVCAFYGLLG